MDVIDLRDDENKPKSKKKSPEKDKKADPYFEPQVFSGKRKRAHTKKLVDEQSTRYFDDDFVLPDDEDFQDESEVSEDISEEDPVPKVQKKKKKPKSSKIYSAIATKAPSVEMKSSVETENRGGARDHTYVGMIREALEHLGGEGSLPDITGYILEQFGEELNRKTKTWRNSVSGCLSTHFGRKEGKDSGGRVIWTLKDSDVVRTSKPKSRPNVTSTSDSNPAPQPTITQYYSADANNKLRRKTKIGKVNFRRLKQMRKKHTDISAEYPPAALEWINKSNQLRLVKKLNHPADVFSMTFSNSQKILATVSNLGSVRLWDTDDWNLLREIRDKSETNLEELYTIAFTPDDSKIVVAGKHKDRKRWNDYEEDNDILPTPIKIFSVETGQLIVKLEEHKEEVLSVRTLRYDDNNFVLSTGQDGQVVKWLMDDDFSEVIEKTIFPDSDTQLCTYSEIVPHTGGMYIMCACDAGTKIYDFESGETIANFPKLYGYLCDCVKFINPLEYELEENEWYLLTKKGVELLDDDGKTIMQPNSCHLRRLTLTEENDFELEVVSTLAHKDYHSNMWMTKFGSNGRYIASPTTDGKIFIWNIRSKELVAVLHDHNTTLRDIVFHPTKPVMIACGEGKNIYLRFNNKDILIYEKVDNPSEPYKPIARPESEDEAKPKRKSKKKAAVDANQQNIAEVTQHVAEVKLDASSSELPSNTNTKNLDSEMQDVDVVSVEPDVSQS